jgi:hypothetical protein
MRLRRLAVRKQRLPKLAQPIAEASVENTVPEACDHATDERRIFLLDEHDLAVGHPLERRCKPGVIGIAQWSGAHDLYTNAPGLSLGNRLEGMKDLFQVPESPFVREQVYGISEEL